MVFLPLYEESFGFGVLEASATRPAVMVRRVDDYADSFGNDVLQCVEADFPSNIKRLRDDPSFYQQRRDRSKLLASRFDSTAAAERYVKLYAGLLNE